MQDSRIIVGLEDGDDAAVFAVNDSYAIIHTLDFFTPVVDDPYDYGAIAAVNAMSDVYAMGGDVQMALNICAFPTDLHEDTISEILRGGADKVAEAGAVVLGGHTVDDPEPKYGLSVVGYVHPEKVITKSKARVGDSLYLTKPLGSGCITTALKHGKAGAAHIESAVKSMKSLNRSAARVMRETGILAATDITGFSLIGHAADMAEKSGVQLIFLAEEIPLLDGADLQAKDGMFPGGTGRNMDHFSSKAKVEGAIAEYLMRLFYTPETSGGLLISVSSDTEDEFRTKCNEYSVECWKIGRVAKGTGIRII